MVLQVAFDQLCHQPVQRAATGGDELQDVFALAVSFKRSFDGLDLPLDASCAGDHLGSTFGSV